MLRILIVEDNELFRTALCAVISAKLPSVAVFEAETVADGLRQSREMSPDMVLIDVQLPDGSGLSLARQIRDEHPFMTLAICTSYDTPEYRDAARECGVCRFIPKDAMSPYAILSLVEQSMPVDAADR